MHLRRKGAKINNESVELRWDEEVKVLDFTEGTVTMSVDSFVNHPFGWIWKTLAIRCEA